MGVRSGIAIFFNARQVAEASAYWWYQVTGRLAATALFASSQVQINKPFG